MVNVPDLTRANEPALFDGNCRTPGAAWLVANPGSDPHDQSDWWSQFKHELARHFGYRCGWLAMWIGSSGTVDHMLSCGPRDGHASPNRHLSFEWTNYRYADGRINSWKGTADHEVLDPCEVQDGWFTVDLTTFMLNPAGVPAAFRDRAIETIRRLHLNGTDARHTRFQWYVRFWNAGATDLANLENDAPLVARAVRDAQALGRALPDPNICEPQYRVRARLRAYAPRRRNTPGDLP